MKRCVMVSGGQDSRILHQMLLKDYPDIVTVNIRKPYQMDVVEDADVVIEHIAHGGSTYKGTLHTVEEKIIPAYDEIWVASTKNPDDDWYANHEEKPARGELLSKYPGKFKTPYQEKYKWEVLQIAIDNKIDLKGTHSCVKQPKAKGHCRTCWFCKERELAYTKLGLDVYWE